MNDIEKLHRQERTLKQLRARADFAIISAYAVIDSAAKTLDTCNIELAVVEGRIRELSLRKKVRMEIL